MSWEQSLVRLADHEVDGLRQRLAAIVDRKTVIEMRIAALHAEAEAEATRSDDDAQAGFYRIGFLQGWRMRRDGLRAELAAAILEEEGARDALTRAFEELKKYEQIADGAVRKQIAERARRDGAEMDELGLRRAAARP